MFSNFFSNTCGTSNKNDIKPGDRMIQIKKYPKQQKPLKSESKDNEDIDQSANNLSVPSFRQAMLSSPVASIQTQPMVKSSNSSKPIGVINSEPESNYVYQATTIVKSSYQQLVKKLKQQNLKFTDPQFPPVHASLDMPVNQFGYEQKWMRVTELFQKPVFFQNGISPQDAVQGYFYGVGNCYLIASIANLARTPERIKKLFVETQVSQQGIYCIRMFVNGIWTEVVIDDYVPTAGGGYMFAHPPKNSFEIWVMLLEKAFAKLAGSYKRINDGLPSEVYELLAGAPSYFYNIKGQQANSQKYWQRVKDASIKNYCIDAGTSAQLTTPQRVHGLKAGHAYTVLGVYQISNFRLLKLRNPIGMIQWDGRASDSDKEFWSKVSKADLKKLNYKFSENELIRNDGVSFMIWQDFIANYGLFEICEIKDTAHTLSLRVKFTKKNAQMFELNTKGGQVTISLIQDSIRNKGQDVTTFQYSKSYLIISKITKSSSNAYQQQYKLIRAGAKSNFAAHHQKLTLQAGKYAIYAKYDWADSVDKQASLVVYTQADVQIKHASLSDYPNFLNKSYLSLANEDLDYVLDNQNNLAVSKTTYLGSDGFGYYAAKLHKNAKSKVAMQIDNKVLQQKHLQLRKPYKTKGKDNVKIVINPGEQVIVLFRSKDRVIPTQLQVPDPLFSKLI